MDVTESQRPLARCEAHGLTYDPSVHSGCVVCRRSEKAPAPESRAGSAITVKNVAMILIMVAWVSGVVFGAKWFFDYSREMGEAMAKAGHDEADDDRPDPEELPEDPSIPSFAPRFDPLEIPSELPMLGREGKDANGYPRDSDDKVGMLTLLRARQFEQLTRYVEHVQREFEADFRKEHWVRDAVGAFATSDPAIGALAKEWIAAHPRSFAPYAARAKQRFATAWYYRGTKFRKKTSDARFDKMKEYLALAKKDVERALQIEPKFVSGHGMQIYIARAVSSHSGERQALDAALRVCPKCFLIRAHYIDSLLPRWGGSYEKMDEFALESQAHAKDNPRLRSLLGASQDDRCDNFRRDEKLEAALHACDAAIASGERGPYYDTRYYVLRDLKRPKEALEAIERAVDLEPQFKRYLGLRGLRRLRSEQYESGVADLRRALAIDPTSTSNNENLDRAVRILINHAHDRHKARQLDRAIELFDLLLTIKPDHSDAMKRRGISYMRKGDRKRAIADYRAASLADPTHYDAFVRLDYALVEDRAFEEIVGHWNRYIKVKPNDGRAFLERGGALFHLKKLDAARGDFERACKLDQKKGCFYVKRLDARAAAAGKAKPQ